MLRTDPEPRRADTTSAKDGPSPARQVAGPSVGLVCCTRVTVRSAVRLLRLLLAMAVAMAVAVSLAVVVAISVAAVAGPADRRLPQGRGRLDRG